MPSMIPTSTLEKFTTFGDLLRFLRRRVGITQMELALAVGYSDAQISRLEQNLRMPDIPTIEARFVPALDLEDEPKAIARLLELASNVRREDAPVTGLCPYKGLNYFDEADADIFVGREGLTSKLMNRVIALVENPASANLRFLAIVGASGSGKSSLVRAGLVPALRWNKISADWNIHIITPTAHPLESLAIELVREKGSIAAAAALMDDFARDHRSLLLFAKHYLKSTNGTRMLLIVDQFEELFALCRSEPERVAFIDNILNAVTAPDGNILVVITLRADFYGHCAGYLQLREALALQQEYIGAMTDEELRRAIEEPARRGRWEFEPGLVDLLLHDVGHEPGALPLLSHALYETWQRRRGRTMTLSGYTSSGGVRGAIAETAEAVFADQFTREQKAIARRIFLRLTELGDETSTEDTRRRVTINELILRPEERDVIQAVLKALADARLIITSENAAEVAHEALIREWPTLRSWLEENRDGLRLHRHLTESALDWNSRQKEADVLYRGARLAQACEWAASHPDELNPLEREFLEASQDLADCEAREREAQRQRELEAAQKLAEAERVHSERQTQAAKQLRKRSVYLAGALGLSLVFLILAGIFGYRAWITSRVATSRELAAMSLSNLGIDPERSVLLALEAISSAKTSEAENALHQSILAARIRSTQVVSEPGVATQIAVSPNERFLATSSANQVIKVWDVGTGALLFSTDGHYASFSPDNTLLATISSQATVKLWHTSSWQEITIKNPINADASVSFSPDGTKLATITGGNLPRIWDLKTGNELVNFPGHGEYVSFAFFSPDGTHLLTTSDDGTARLWDTTTAEEKLKLSDHPGWVWTAAFSPDGTRIVTISGNEGFLWDAVSGKKLLTFSGHSDAIYAVAFDTSGSRLATGGKDRKVILWDSTNGRELLRLNGHTGAITGLVFTRNGTQLTTASEDGTLRTWDITPSRELLRIDDVVGAITHIVFQPEHKYIAGTNGERVILWDTEKGERVFTYSLEGNIVTSLAFRPDGKYLVTAGDDRHVEIWDVDSGELISSLPAHTGKVNAVQFTPDGAFLVTASDDFKVKVWDVNQLIHKATVEASLVGTMVHSGKVRAVAFSPDGKLLATGGDIGNVQVWDFKTRAQLFTLQGHSDSIVSISFHPNKPRLATASLDGTVKVWDIRHEKELFNLHGHNAAVTAVRFSRDGERIVSSSQDGTTRVWDGTTGQGLFDLPGDGKSINDLAISPDGTQLALAGQSGILFYSLELDDLIRIAHSRLTRSLTAEECQEYLHRQTSSCERKEFIPTPSAFPVVAQGRICQIVGLGGLDDNYFNALTWKGLQDSQRDYGWLATELLSNSNDDFGKNMQAFLNADCNLIVMLGPQLEVLKEAADLNPEKKFMTMDFILDPHPENLWTQIYATDQAAFLAGYLAASFTKTGKVGVFGGIDIPQVTDFMDGFYLGVQYYNHLKHANVSVIGWDVQKHSGYFIGGFCCTTEGREMARRLLDEGADIILPVAGYSPGWGAGAEILEHGNAWLIGVDTDWSVTAPELKSIVLTSIEKRFDASVLQVSRAIIEDNFIGGIHTGNLATGEVRLSPFYEYDSQISAQTKLELEQIIQEIISGKIKTRP